jgi:hypothetical protein
VRSFRRVILSLVVIFLPNLARASNKNISFCKFESAKSIHKEHAMHGQNLEGL